jgi:2-dehydro-3-deoxygluconokinase
MIVFVPERAGELENASFFRANAAGAELNVAAALASLGAPTAWLSRVGDDGFGRQLLAHARSRGIDTSGVEIDGSRPTGIYIKEYGSVQTGPGRSRMHYYRSGSAASALSTAFWKLETTRHVLDRSAILHLSGITAALSPSARRLSLAARHHFCGLVSVDANWRPALWAGRTTAGRRTITALMRTADIVFIGADEAGVILGTDDPDAIRRLVPRPRYLIIKNDALGAVGYDRRDRVDVPTTRIDVVEPIGAGDAFAGGALASLSQQASIEEAISVGHATAMRALTTSGDHL